MGNKIAPGRTGATRSSTAPGPSFLCRRSTDSCRRPRPPLFCMTTKEEKPTLGGVTIKTRKRNIAVPLDPASFANAVIAIFDDAEGEGVADILSAGCKVLETSTLDFSRYGDTLFEVLFAGGRMTAGGSLEENEAELRVNLLKQDPSKEEIMPFISTFQQLIRRRPFLIKSLENTMCKFLKSLEFFDSSGRKKISIANALIFSNKLGVLPEYLANCSMDDLIVLLKKAKMEKRMMDFFPAERRTPEKFNQHFEEANLPAIVEYSKNQFDADKQKEMQETLMAAIKEEPPNVAEVIKMFKEKKEATKLSDVDSLKVAWVSLMDALS